MGKSRDMKTLEAEIAKSVTDPFFKDADQLNFLMRFIMHHLYQLHNKVEKVGVGRYRVTTPKDIYTITVDRRTKDE